MVGRGLLSTPQYGLLIDLLNSLLKSSNCIINMGCEPNFYAWTIWIQALFGKGYVKETCSYCLDMMEASTMLQTGIT